ncbi:zinc-dependent alcohol dehydrogenase [Dactylosporangium sp. CS-047395]|uniref:zinc-dependent alcohol dehydrogenase n=1 Tax=Dactylosporangium sp. CS-047395 TaxID=3239936 RepID=UPI003D8EBDE2
MKAVVWHGVGDIRLEDVAEPKIQAPTDAIVRITTSALCGTDLHLIRGTMPGMRDGTIIGHEAVGEVVETGSGVRNFSTGDRVVVPSTISCGSCSYCRAGYQAQCDNANPGGKLAGTAFFGGPEAAGAYDGLQAQYARIPYANGSLVPVPPGVDDAQAIMVSDIFPTAWFGAKLAEVGNGDTVAVFGAGPVGQLAILSAYLQGAGRVIAVDHIADRLALAQAQHAEIVDFDTEDPVGAIRELTGGVGVDRVIDAVGVDAQRPATRVPAEQAEQFDAEQRQAAPASNGQSGQWVPGDAPSQVSRWAAQAVAKAGTIGVIGVYPQTITGYPIGEVMNKNLTVQAGNCNHRHYMPYLLQLIAGGGVDPALLLTETAPMTDVLAAYRAFDRREPGWVKVALNPAA